MLPTHCVTQRTFAISGRPGAEIEPVSLAEAAAKVGYAIRASEAAARPPSRRRPGTVRDECGFGVNELPLFLEPVGLAVGLALKELRYGPLRPIRPWGLGPSGSPTPGGRARRD